MNQKGYRRPTAVRVAFLSGVRADPTLSVNDRNARQKPRYRIGLRRIFLRAIIQHALFSVDNLKEIGKYSRFRTVSPLAVIFR